MGDEADALIDQFWDDPFAEEWDDDEPFVPALKTCRYCGMGGFHWEMADGKWRLHDEARKIHACKVKPLPAEPKPREVEDPVERAFRAGFDKGYGTFSYEEGGLPQAFSRDRAWKEYRKP